MVMMIAITPSLNASSLLFPIQISLAVNKLLSGLRSILQLASTLWKKIDLTLEDDIKT
jgi:hypothetical protein